MDGSSRAVTLGANCLNPQKDPKGRFVGLAVIFFRIFPFSILIMLDIMKRILFWSGFIAMTIDYSIIRNLAGRAKPPILPNKVFDPLYNYLILEKWSVL